MWWKAQHMHKHTRGRQNPGKQTAMHLVSAGRWRCAAQTHLGLLWHGGMCPAARSGAMRACALPCLLMASIFALCYVQQYCRRTLYHTAQTCFHTLLDLG